MPAGPARGAETPGHARARPASRLSAEPRAAAPEGGDGTPSRWQEADGEKLAPSPRGDRTFVWVGDRPGERRFNCEPPPRLFQKLAGHTSRNKQMTKKHLIIVMRSAREGLSEPRLIKAVCQGAVRPSRGCRHPPDRPGPAVSRGTRRVINAGDIDGGKGLPRPRRQLDGSALPKRGGRAMHQPPANAGPRLLLTRCGPGFSTTGDDAVTHQASTPAVPWPLEPDPHGHRGDPFPGTPSLPPSSAEALGGGRRVSRSGLHLPSRRVARLWWRGLRGQTPRHGEAPCPRAGPLPPGSAGHPHAGLAVPARLTPGPSSLRLRGLHLQPVNETRSSSTRGRLPERGGGCGRRHTADPGAATPAPPLCQSPPQPSAPAGDPGPSLPSCPRSSVTGAYPGARLGDGRRGPERTG